MYDKKLKDLKDSLVKCQNQAKSDKLLLEDLLSKARKEIQQLKDSRKLDKETIELQKIELSEQTELLEETTELLNNANRQFMEFKKNVEGKICRCMDPGSSKLCCVDNNNTTIQQLQREIEKYKSQLIRKQEQVIQNNSEMIKCKQMMQDLQTQLISREKNLAEKQQKIHEGLANAMLLEDQIKRLKDEREFISVDSSSSQDLLEDLQIKLTYSRSSLETNKSKLEFKEKEVAQLRKSYKEVKQELQFYMSENTALKAKLRSSHMEGLDKELMITTLQQQKESLLNSRDSINGK